MVKVFVGFEHREAVGLHVLMQSVLDYCDEPVEVIPLGSLIAQRDGSNAFTYSRFLIPYLCDFKGHAIFLECDMLLRDSIMKLWRNRDTWSAVQVVQHDYKTKYPRKYIGTDLECDNRDYPRKNWSSVAIWNCAHMAHRKLTPEYVRAQTGSFLHRFGWVDDNRVDPLPPEWNLLVGEQPYNPEAKLAHFTLGIPAFTHYRDCDYADEWRKTYARAQRGMQEHA